MVVNFHCVAKQFCRLNLDESMKSLQNCELHFITKDVMRPLTSQQAARFSIMNKVHLRLSAHFYTLTQFPSGDSTGEFSMQEIQLYFLKSQNFGLDHSVHSEKLCSLLDESDPCIKPGSCDDKLMLPTTFFIGLSDVLIGTSYICRVADEFGFFPFLFLRYMLKGRHHAKLTVICLICSN